MIRVVVLEPSSGLREVLRMHLSGIGPELHVAASLEEAQRAYAAAELVVVRSGLDPDLAAAYPCAFELDREGCGVRLVALATHEVPAGREAGKYVHEIDRLLAARAWPGALQPVAAPGIPPDFPTGQFEPLGRLGSLPAAQILRVRERISGRKAIVVQVDDAHPEGPAATRRLYRAFAARGGPGSFLRHEYTPLHSFIHVDALPLDFATAREHEAAAAALAEAGA